MMTAVRTRDMGNTRETRRLNPRSDPASPWWHIDPTPVLCALVLGVIGLFGIYSATRGRDPENHITTFIEKQGLFIGVGLVALVVLLFIDYRILARLAPLGYLAMCVSLVLVLLTGTTANGATSWFALGDFRLQPSEFAKLILIVVIATMLARREQGPLPLPELVRILAVAILPIGLIIRQPDVGTAMVFVVIVAAMLLVGQAEAHHMMFLIAASVLGIGLLLNSSLLQEYQRDRLESFLDPSADASYNQVQAGVAIGNGGLTGTGFGQGTQTKSGLVPEQQTDFIFTVIGEEFGFVGATVVLIVFALLLWRIYRIARLAGDPFGAYLATGVLAMMGFQMFQSIGMTVGIMPITGIPLPFVSYGGSSALTSFLAIGLVISVNMRRFAAGIDAEVANPAA